MTANDAQTRIQPRSLQQGIAEWFKKRAPRGVLLRENTIPVNESTESYKIVYEVSFEPTALDQARVEIWVTDTGATSLGFEKRHRVAARLGVRAYQPHAFVAGHEPLFISEDATLAALEAIASAQVGVMTRVMPILGLVSTRAVMSTASLDALLSRGNPARTWVHQIATPSTGATAGYLSFKPWD